MLHVKENTGEETTVKNVEQLLARIPNETLEQLKQQVNNDPDFDYYLGQFVDQNRKTTASALVKDVSRVVRILHWKKEDKIPGSRGFGDWVMFHYVTPDPHALGGRESAIWGKAKEAIAYAQGNYRFNGGSVLGVYSAYTAFFKEQDIDAGDLDKLTELGLEAELGSYVEVSGDNLVSALRDLPPGKRFIMPFDYGAHQTYIRVSHNHQSYRFECFDRQRQTLILQGKEIPGYYQGTAMANAQPIYFDFQMESKALADLCREAWSIATQLTGPGETVDVPRQKVLEKFAEAANDFGVFGASESAQHPDAINCPWASLESVIRLEVGPEALQKQVEFIREVAVTLYISENGASEEKEAAGLALPV